MNRPTVTRREWMIGAGLGAAAAVLPAKATVASGRLPRRGDAPEEPGQGTVRFGVIADVHQDVMHDGERRLERFLRSMREADPDFIVQLGDFCVPHERNDAFLALWNSHRGARYHVIGNHDTDGGYTRDQTVAYYGMPARYYSFDQSGVHFVVLDGNDPGGTSGGYARFITPDQVDWLRADLAAHDLPTVVMVHQPLDSTDGADNRAQIRRILEESNVTPGHAKVLAVLAGHSHIDYCRQINGIYYAMINSASYQWVGGDYRHQSYAPGIHEAHGSLDRTCPYRDPLWAMVTIDLESGSLRIEGRETEWVGPSPAELGADFENGYWGWDPRYSRPRISGWRAPVRSTGDLG